MAITGNPDRAARITGAPPTQGETLFRAALPIAPETFDAAAFTVRAVVATKTPVPRRDSRGPFMEVLDPAGLRPQPQTYSVSDHHRGEAAGHDVPLLSDHEPRARATIGRAFGFAIEGETVTATLRFGQADDILPLVQRVRDGTLRSVSAGYRALRWVESIADGQRIRTAVEWEIMEVSLVPIPADPRASIQLRSESIMPTEIEQEALQTRTEIRTIARAANLPAEWADEQIDAGASAIEARAAAFEEMQTRAANRPQIRIVAQHDAAEAIRTRAADALAYRMGGMAELPEASRQYMPLTLRQHAEEALHRAGMSSRGMGVDELFQRAATTSDFPELVSNAAGKTAAQAYKYAESPLKRIARRRLVSNFKTSSSIRLGELGRLQPLTEQGEFQHVGRAEEAEELKIGTYGAALHISRKLLIDDDLSLLADAAEAFGVAAAQTEADLLVALFSDNPMMKDGATVFHASRGNLMAGGGAGTGLGDTGAASFLAQARSALRAVKGADGKTIVGAAPKYLLVGPDSEDAALRLLTETTPARASDVNTLAGVAELIVDPRIPGEDWYLLADPARMPGIVIAYLASAPGVQVQRAEAWDTLGLKFRAWLDFGCGWTDWRGAYKGA